MSQHYDTEPSRTQDTARIQQGWGDESLMAAQDSQELSARWNAIQANFVDDPRAAVKDADQLVRDVFDRITQAFTQQREELTRQWAKGDEPDTEALRIALQRYRGFFQRFLSVT